MKKIKMILIATFISSVLFGAFLYNYTKDALLINQIEIKTER